MEKVILQPTPAYTMLLENAASVYDCREEGIAAGILAEDMKDLEAINWLNALILFHKFDHIYSPGTYLNFLKAYCRPEYAEGLKWFYPQIAAREGVTLADNVWESTTEIIVDIFDYAKATKEKDGKKHWGAVFNDIHIEQWNAAFDGKPSPDSVAVKTSLISRILGK